MQLSAEEFLAAGNERVARCAGRETGYECLDCWSSCDPSSLGLSWRG